MTGDNYDHHCGVVTAVCHTHTLLHCLEQILSPLEHFLPTKYSHCQWCKVIECCVRWWWAAGAGQLAFCCYWNTFRMQMSSKFVSITVYRSEYSIQLFSKPSCTFPQKVLQASPTTNRIDQSTESIDHPTLSDDRVPSGKSLRLFAP